MSGALGAVSMVLLVYAFDVRGECSLEKFGQESDPVFTALAGSNDDVARVEVDVLDSQARAFEEP